MRYSNLTLKLIDSLFNHPEGLTREALREKTKPVTWSSVALPGGIKSGLYHIKKARLKRDDLYTLTSRGKKDYELYRSQGPSPETNTPARTETIKDSFTPRAATDRDYLDPIAASYIEAIQAPANLNRELNKFLADIKDQCAAFLRSCPRGKPTSKLDTHNHNIVNKIIQIQSLINS